MDDTLRRLGAFDSWYKILPGRPQRKRQLLRTNIAERILKLILEKENVRVWNDQLRDLVNTVMNFARLITNLEPLYVW